MEFTKEKISAHQKIAKDLFNDLEFSVGSVNDDLQTDMLTMRMTAYIYSHISEEQDLVYYCPKPTFMDWIRGRRKRVVFELKIKDLLINAPKLPNTQRIYIADLKENN